MNVTREDLTKGVRYLDGKAILRCSKDFMAAWITFEDEMLPSQVKALISNLQQDTGICHGLLDIPELMDDGSYLIARGTEPIPGKDGQIEYKVAFSFGLGGTETRKKEDESGAYDQDEKDPLERDYFVNVKKGDILAVKIPPTKGTPGKNIFGEEVPAQPGKIAAFKPGKGVEIAIDDMVLKAAIRGIVVLDETERINVFDTWTIEGDVDASIGHIHFWGKELEIKGSICEGMKVDTRGDLLVGGNIENWAWVKVGGNLKVLKLIRADCTKVMVEGELLCKAIEQARVDVEKDLEVYDYILDADCRVGGDIWLVKGRGLFLGRRIMVGGSVVVNVTGSEANVPVVIRAGYAPNLEERYKVLIKEIENSSEKLAQVKEGLRKLEMLEKKKPLSDKMQTLKGRLGQAMQDLTEYIQQKRQELDELQARIGKLQEATIQVVKRAHGNTRIYIYNASKVLKQDVDRVKFVFYKGEIQMRELNKIRQREREG